MKVIILTEGTRTTGYGHLTRCQSIYQAFEEKGIIPVYIANCDERGKEILGGINVVCFNWLIEQEKLREIVTRADVLIIDSYLASKDIYSDLTARVEKAAYIDDYQRIEYPKGIIINGTIDAENLFYGKALRNELLLGVKYIPIRKEFWKVHKKKINTTVQEVLITFGGHDQREISFSVLDILLHEFKEMKYNVVLGGRKFLDAMKKYSNEKNIEYFHSLTAQSMLDLMLKCDIALSAAGQTLYELARVGVPTVAIGVVQNQRNNIVGWLKNNFVLDMLWSDDSDLNEKIVSSFMRTAEKGHREMIIHSMPLIVDGKGALRIAEFLL